MTHDVRCIALRQLETALRLHFEGGDYYSIITLAGASEEIFGGLVLEKFMNNVDSALTDFLSDRGQSSPEFSSAVKTYAALRKKLVNITSQFPQCPEESWTTNDSKLRSNFSKIYKNLAIAMKKMADIADSSDGLPNECKRVISGIKPAIIEQQLSTLSGQEEEPTEFDVRRRANWTRNILKHWRPGQPKVVEFDAQSEAKDMLNRAIENYCSLTGELTPAMQTFWCMS